MNELEKIEMQMSVLKEMYRRNLESKIEFLIKNLERELEQLKNNPSYKPNSCGIIQNEATNIDELCIKLGVLDSVKQS